MQIDVSIEALHYFLQPGVIINKIFYFKNILAKGVPTYFRDEIYRRRMEDSKQEIDDIEIDKIIAVITGIWTEKGFKLEKDKYKAQMSAVNDALLFASLSYYPNILTLGHCDSQLSLLLNEEKNFFLEYYRNVLIPTLLDFKPDLIGISYNYTQQIYPGMSLSAEIHKAGIDVPIVAGGSLISQLGDELAAGDADEAMVSYTDLMQEYSSANLLAALLDSCGIRGEGEGPLLELCKRTAERKSYNDIPNLIYRNKKNKTIRINKKGPLLPVRDIPVIKLDGLPIGKKYLTPIPLAPLLSSRGCYWNKCTFCNHAAIIDSCFRELPRETVVQTLALYKEKYGIELALFCDEGMSPSMLKGLSKELSQLNLEINFGTMIRIEKGLLNLIAPASQSGCVYLAFGLESAVPRVVSLMNKGYTHDTAVAILEECSRNEIFVQYFVMFGFPTERYEEARQTIRFLEKHQDKIGFIRATPWGLTKNCYIAENLHDFGIIARTDLPVSGDPGSYILKEGINIDQSRQLAAGLLKNPLLREKCGNIYCKNEEFMLLHYLCSTGPTAEETDRVTMFI
ncbi:B12-binding domain-containing radical SAM protein [Acidobacteriota bacterium]